MSQDLLYLFYCLDDSGKCSLLNYNKNKSTCDLIVVWKKLKFRGNMMGGNKTCC